MRRAYPLIGRRWCALLLAVALATRLLTPEGWMPAVGGGVMLCPGAGMPMVGAGDHRRDVPVPDVDHRCPFAQVAMVAPPPVPLAWTAPVLPASAKPVLRLTPAVGHGLAAPPPPATGPPAFA